MDRKNWRPFLACEDVLEFASDSYHQSNEARAKRMGPFKTQDTTIEFGIIIIKDEIGMKGESSRS